MRQIIQKLLVNINYFIYDWSHTAIRVLRALRALVNVFIFGLIFYLLGFYQSMNDVGHLGLVLEWSVISLVVLFFLRIFFSLQRTAFMRSNLAETIISFFIVLIWLIDVILSHDHIEKAGQLLNVGYRREGIILIIFAITYLLIFIVEISRVYATSVLSRVSPSFALVLSFMLLILFGAILLMLPEMTTSNDPLSFVDAMFMSASATCVTGLSLFDVGTYFTFRGQLIMLFLIQAGGLGILYFTSFFASLLGNSLRFQQQLIFKENVDASTLFDTDNMMRSIFRITFLIEAITAVLIFFTWDDKTPFISVGQKIYYSIFHAISAFCNAGFSLLSDGLYNVHVRDSYLLHMVIIAAVIVGGIGFNTITDLFSPARLRERLQKPWIDWKPSTKVAVFTSIVLLFVGTVSYILLENGDTLEGKGLFEKVIISFFQSATTRTAGFNTVDMASISLPVVAIMIVLMFIGASSGSVGGGIKTSTFFVIFASVLQLLKGRKGVYISKRFLANDLYFKALAIFAFAIAYNTIAFILLAIIHPDMDAISLLFEQVSAFGTVGLSLGITAALSVPAKILITFSMFLGRVGILTFAYSISGQRLSKNYKYPITRIMVG